MLFCVGDAAKQHFLMTVDVWHVVKLRANVRGRLAKNLRIGKNLNEPVGFLLTRYSRQQQGVPHVLHCTTRLSIGNSQGGKLQTSPCE